MKLLVIVKRPAQNVLGAVIMDGRYSALQTTSDTFRLRVVETKIVSTQ